MPLFRVFLILAGLSGALAVTAGAFAAHGLEPLRGARAVALWQTASTYQLIHAVALAVLAALARVAPGRLLAVAGIAFTGGSLLFCGALYGLGWWGPSALGAVAPLGGLSFIAGWLALAAAGWRAGW